MKRSRISGKLYRLLIITIIGLLLVVATGVSATFLIAAEIADRTTMVAIASVLAFTVILTFFFYTRSLIKSISKPLVALDKWFLAIAQKGDITLQKDEIDFLNKHKVRTDEIGTLFSSVEGLIAFLNNFCNDLRVVANGDLSIDVKVRNERDILALELHKTIESLNEMLGEVINVTVHMSSDAENIYSGADTLSKGAAEQASSIQNLVANASDIAERTKANAELTDKAARLAGDIKSNAERGSRQMDEMVSAVNEISAASQNISKVIKAIDDIAFQTNILALNAAVEAARAGQHGKGFAVVAEEVRTLAAKSAEAAKDTGVLISSSIEKSEYGARIAQETAASLEGIVSGISESAEIIKEIAKDSDAQTGGMRQINSGIEKVANVVQQNSSVAKESAASAMEMSSQAISLAKLTEQFKLKQSSRGIRPSSPHRQQPKAALPAALPRY